MLFSVAFNNLSGKDQNCPQYPTVFIFYNDIICIYGHSGKDKIVTIPLQVNITI